MQSSLLACMPTARVSLAEIFHPWVRWEGPESGLGSSSGGAATGAWKFLIFSKPFVLREFEKWDPDKSGFSQNQLFCGILKNGTRTFSQNLKFPKSHVPSIQIELILSYTASNGAEPKDADRHLIVLWAGC